MNKIITMLSVSALMLGFSMNIEASLASNQASNNSNNHSTEAQGDQTPAFPPVQFPTFPAAQTPAFPPVQFPTFPAAQIPAFPPVQAFPGDQAFPPAPQFQAAEIPPFPFYPPQKAQPRPQRDIDLDNAITSGNLEAVKQAIAKGANIKGHLPGDNAITKAIKAGKVDIVRYFIEEKGIMANDSFQLQFIRNIATDPQTIQYLNEKIAEINNNPNRPPFPPIFQPEPQLSAQDSALAKAIEEGNLEAVKKAVEEQHADVNASFSPLMKAIRGQHIKIVRYLVGKGAIAYNNGSPIIAAAYTDNFEILKYLIEQDVDETGSGTEWGKLKLTEALGAITLSVDLPAKFYDFQPDESSAVLKHIDPQLIKTVKYLVQKGASTAGNPTASQIIELITIDQQKKAPYKKLYNGIVNKKLEDVQAAIAEGVVDLSNMYTVFLDAVFTKYVPVVQYLVEHGMWPTDYHGDKSIEPITMAIENNDMDMLDYLLGEIRTEGEKVSITPLLLDAVYNRNLDLVKHLVDHGAWIINDIRIAEEPLRIALNNRDMQILDYLASKEHAPLHNIFREAVMNKDLEVAELMLNHGANANDMCDGYFSLLTMAVRNNDFPMVKSLVEHGADINDKNGEYYGDDNTVGYEYGYDYKPLVEAVGVNNMEMVQYLVKHLLEHAPETAVRVWRLGNNPITIQSVNIGDKQGRTALIRAVEDNNLPMVEYLVTVPGIDLDKTRKYMHQPTPLAIAARNENFAIVKCLADNGADVNLAFHSAVLTKNRQIIDYLLSKKANPTLGISGAIMKDDLEMVKYLVETHHADLSSPDSGDYRSCLQLARENREMTEYLAKHGANPNIGYHFSALIDAVASGDLELVKLFMEHGGDANAKDENGNTALSIAKGEIAEYLKTRALKKEVSRELVERVAAKNSK